MTVLTERLNEFEGALKIEVDDLSEAITDAILFKRRRAWRC